MRTRDTDTRHLHFSERSPFTLCHNITPKHDQVTNLYTLWATPSVTVSKV